MKTKLVRIGRSRGVRLPKALLDQCQCGDEVELAVESGRIVIQPIPFPPLPRPRAGWEEAFRAMAAAGDDKLLDADEYSQSLILWEAEDSE